MKRLLSIGVCLLVHLVTYSQDNEDWSVYMAQYEKGPGSTVLNMSLKAKAPVKDYSFVLITGIEFQQCSDGLPLKGAFQDLYDISDSVQKTLDQKIPNILAGTFTYQCERSDYFYVKDTAGIRQLLANLYTTRFSKYAFHIRLKEDKPWQAYLAFLYPNEETREFIKNGKVVSQLQNAGDKLDKPRQVDHWLYFDEQADVNCFIVYAKANGFKIIVNEKTGSGAAQKIKLQIARIDKVSQSEITKVTLVLRSEAKKCKGDYDGWETFVIK